MALQNDRRWLLLVALTSANALGRGYAYAEPGTAGSPATDPAGVSAPVVSPDTQLPHRGTTLPANGSVLVDLYASGSLGVGLYDEMNHMLDLSTRHIDTYWVLTPLVPMQPGATAQLILGTATTTSVWLSFGAARSPHRPDLTARLSVKLNEQDSASECCSRLPGHPGNRTCFRTRTTTTAVGSIALASSEDASALTQVLFRVRPVDSPSAESVRFQPLWRPPTLIWETQADQYCVEIDAVEIGTDDRYSYPELSPLCVAHADLGPVGEHLRIEDPEHVLDHSICQVPPSDAAELWCQVNQVACEISPVPAGCEAYAHECHGEALPTPPREPKPRARVMPVPLDQGCSVLYPQRARRGSWLAVGLLWFVLRRRQNAAHENRLSSDRCSTT